MDRLITRFTMNYIEVQLNEVLMSVQWYGWMSNHACNLLRYIDTKVVFNFNKEILQVSHIALSLIGALYKIKQPCIPHTKGITVA